MYFTQVSNSNVNSSSEMMPGTLEILIYTGDLVSIEEVTSLYDRELKLHKKV